MRNDTNKDLSEVGGSYNDMCRLCEKSKVKEKFLHTYYSRNTRNSSLFINECPFQLLNIERKNNEVILESFICKLDNFKAFFNNQKLKKLIFPCKCLLPVHEICLIKLLLISQNLTCSTCNCYFGFHVPTFDFSKKLSRYSNRIYFHSIIFFILITIVLIIILLSDNTEYSYEFRFWKAIFISISAFILFISLLIYRYYTSQINNVYPCETIHLIDYQTINIPNNLKLSLSDLEKSTKEFSPHLSANVFCNFLNIKFKISLEDIIDYKTFRHFKLKSFNSDYKKEYLIYNLNDQNKNFFGFSTINQEIEKEIFQKMQVNHNYSNIIISEKGENEYQEETQKNKGNDYIYDRLNSRESIEIIQTDKKMTKEKLLRKDKINWKTEPFKFPMNSVKKYYPLTQITNNLINITNYINKKNNDTEQLENENIINLINFQKKTYSIEANNFNESQLSLSFTSSVIKNKPNKSFFKRSGSNSNRISLASNNPEYQKKLLVRSNTPAEKMPKNINRLLEISGPTIVHKISDIKRRFKKMDLSESLKYSEMSSIPIIPDIELINQNFITKTRNKEPNLLINSISSIAKRSSDLSIKIPRPRKTINSNLTKVHI